jgi:hypothetical protein
MSSGLYPAMCSGNSLGGVCNPLDVVMNDWQIPSLYPGLPLVMEQSFPWGGGQAALAWLWAVTHGAWQIHAQKETLVSSLGTEWRETTEYMLEHPEAAIWVAWEDNAPSSPPSSLSDLCAKIGRPYYCPELGNWKRNISREEGGSQKKYNLQTNSYYQWFTRQGPLRLTTNISRPVEITVVLEDGTRRKWTQDNGQTVNIEGNFWIHRVEIRPTEGSPPPACFYKSQGDANCDDLINLFDFEIWREEFNNEKVSRDADFNKDNYVNERDFDIWKNNLD